MPPFWLQEAADYSMTRQDLISKNNPFKRAEDIRGTAERWIYKRLRGLVNLVMRKSRDEPGTRAVVEEPCL
jgi:hypothetical protein